MLRRLTRHITSQNWLAVILDFVIVVAGILIAFQITTWNEERKARNEAVHVLNLLADDLNLYKTISENIVKFYDSQIEGGEKILSWLEQDELASEDRQAFEAALENHGKIFEPDILSISKLLAKLRSGDVIVGNPDLEQALRDFDGRLSAARTTHTHIVQRLNTAFPTIERYASVGPRLEDGKQFSFVAYDFDRMRTNPEFRVAFSAATKMLVYARNLHRNIGERTERLRSDISTFLDETENSREQEPSTP